MHLQEKHKIYTYINLKKCKTFANCALCVPSYNSNTLLQPYRINVNTFERSFWFIVNSIYQNIKKKKRNDMLLMHDLTQILAYMPNCNQDRKMTQHEMPHNAETMTVKFSCLGKLQSCVTVVIPTKNKTETLSLSNFLNPDLLISLSVFQAGRKAFRSKAFITRLCSCLNTSMLNFSNKSNSELKSYTMKEAKLLLILLFFLNSLS